MKWWMRSKSGRDISRQDEKMSCNTPCCYPGRPRYKNSHPRVKSMTNSVESTLPLYAFFLVQSHQGNKLYKHVHSSKLSNWLVILPPCCRLHPINPHQISWLFPFKHTQQAYTGERNGRKAVKDSSFKLRIFVE